MKINNILIGICISTLIFAGVSFNIGKQTNFNGGEIYVAPHREYHLKFTDFGGKIMINFKITSGGKNSSKNITIYLDGKKIPSSQWILTNYIGVHTITINSTKPVNMIYELNTKGISYTIPFSFLIISIISGIFSLVLHFKKRKLSHP